MSNPWFSAMEQLLWLIGILLGSLGIGRTLLRCCQLKPLPGRVETVLGLGLGLLALSCLVFTVTAFHLLSKPMLVGLTCSWIIGALLNLKLPLLPLITEEAEVFHSWPAKGLAVLFVLHVLMNLLSALTPMWDWDGLAYHLALPKIYLAAGGFVFRPDIFHNLFPQFTEMLYTLSLLYPFGSAAKLIHCSLGLLAAASLYCLGRGLQWRTGALLTTVIFYIQYLIHLESGTAFIDLSLAAYLALALLAIQHAMNTQDDAPWLNLSALLAGAAAASKWHGLMILGMVWILLLVKIWTRLTRLPKTKLRLTLSVVAWGLLPVAPYLIRALVLGHNPIWPLGFSIFGGLEMDTEGAKAMAASIANFAGVAKGIPGLLRLPYDLIMQGAHFGVGGYELRYPLLGGLLLLATSAWYAKPLLTPLSQSSQRWLALYGLLGFSFILIWFFSSPQLRFLLPLFVPGALLAGFGLHGLWHLPGRFNKLAALLIGSLLLCVHPPVHKDSFEQVQVVTGAMPITVFLNSRINHYPACDYLNQHLLPTEKVLLFKENRGFYLNVAYQWGDPLNQSVINYRKLPSSQALAKRLRELGITWILFQDQAVFSDNYYTPTLLTNMEQLLQDQAEKKFSANGATVYRLKD